MADQNKDRGSRRDNLDRDDELQGTRSGSSAAPSNTGGSTSGTNPGSKSTGGAQNTGRPTDDIDLDEFDDIDDVSGNR